MSNSPSIPASFRFGQFTLDLERGALRGADGDVKLRPQSFQVLKTLVENHGRLVTKAQLQELVWKDTVVTDDSLTHCLIDIRKAIGDKKKDIIKTVPRRGFMFDAAVAPVDGAAYRAYSTNEKSGRWRLVLGLASTFVAIGGLWLVAGSDDNDPGTTPDRTVSIGNSIAVLPFENRSADPNDAYIVEGIHDDILSSLAKVGSLRVISRTSVEKFAGTDQTMPEIGKALGVDSILEGGVQRAGDIVRINVQLIDAATDSHIWVETYNRQLHVGNVLEVQSEIASDIALAMNAVISPEEKAQVSKTPTENLQAYDAFLRGTRLLWRRNGAAIEAAIKNFEEAIRLDPDFALAHVGLADSFMLLPNYTEKSHTEWLPRALAQTRSALDLDPDLGEAYASMAVIHAEAGRRRIGIESALDAESLFQSALTLSPNYAAGRQWYGEFLDFDGRLSEAIGQYQVAVEIDPLSPILNHVYGRTLARAGRLVEAEARLLKAIEIDPAFARAHQGLAAIYFVDLGRLNEAAEAAHKAVLLNPRGATNAALLAQILINLRDIERAKLWITEANRLDSDNLNVMGATISLYNYQKDFVPANRVAERALARQPRINFFLNTLRNYYLQEGNPALAVTLFEDAYPEFHATGGPNFKAVDIETALDYAVALQRDNRHLEAAAIMDRADDLFDVDSLSWNGNTQVTMAILQTLRGEHENALSSLTQAVDMGWRYHALYRFEDDPAFADIRERPDFQALAERVRSDLAAQFSRVSL